MKIFLSPHNDDETLFGAFTIIREHPTVCVVFDSFVQQLRGVPNCDRQTRRDETSDAVRILTRCSSEVNFLGLMDSIEQHNVTTLAALFLALYPDDHIEQVWAPVWEPDGHIHHNAVALAADIAFPGKVIHYHTYNRTNGKSCSHNEVLPRSGEEIALKLRALACYVSQHQIDPRLWCWPHFMNDLREYYAN